MNLSGKRVFVTGGAGMLGSHVARALCDRGAIVETVRSADCDLTDRGEAWGAVRYIRPDVVIHCAAKVGGILANKKQPYEFGDANIRMGLNVIDACAREKTPRLVMIGSTCSYPLVPPHFPFCEEDLEAGHCEETNASYGLAKRFLVRMTAAAVKEGRLPFGTSVILANMYGPNDNFDRETSHTIPALIRRYLDAKERSKESVVNWGTGEATRDFLHVRDAAEGVCRVAESWEETSPVNLGTGVEVKIKDLSAIVANLVGYRGKIEWTPGDNLDGQPRRALDCTRAWNGLAWRPRIELTAGLKETIQWWRDKNASLPS